MILTDTKIQDVPRGTDVTVKFAFCVEEEKRNIVLKHNTRTSPLHNWQKCSKMLISRQVILYVFLPPPNCQMHLIYQYCFLLYFEECGAYL